MMNPLELLSESWAFFAERSIHLAAFGVVIALLGWFASRCRLDWRAKIAASHVTLLTLTIGGLVVLLGPLLEFSESSPLPVVSEILDAANKMAEDVELPLPKKLGMKAGSHAADVVSVSRPHVFLAWFWLVGAALGLLRLGVDWRRLSRHLRALPQATGDELNELLAAGPASWREDGLSAIILLDAGASGPYSTRLGGATIVLPLCWSREQPAEVIELALAHEDAHLRHGDAWCLLAWRVAKILWWWNPFVNSLTAHAEELAEWRADALAIGKQPKRARILAAALVEMAAGTAPVAVQSMAARTAHSLQRRLVQLISPDARSSRHAIVHQAILGLLAAMAAGTMVGCAFRGSPKPNPFVNGEIIRTTPNEWPKVERRFPAMVLDASNSATKAGDRMASQLEARARKHGRASGRLIKVEIKFIESQTEASQPDTTDGVPRILSAGELNTYLRSIMRDPRTKIISYPRMAGRAGHAMVIRSVVNQPMLGSSQSRQLDGGGASTEVDIRYAPVGTMLWLCPVFTSSDRIHIATDLVISRIIGEEKFEGNPYPIVSAWRRAPALTIAQGESVMIAGPIDKSGRRTQLVITAAR